ncbi:MAG: cation diffusion facilitator family transporter [Pseudomonadota bacterium]
MISSSIRPYAWLSIATALVTIALKTIAWWLTDSVGLLSDALESLVNLASALMALVMLSIAARPEDEQHAYGHGKAEYFSSGFEGLLICFAALAISVAAIERLLHPQEINQLGIGILISMVASVINFATARVLIRGARIYRSITLEASAKHLITDVWTTLGVIVAIAVFYVTGWLWVDPVIALIIAGNIFWAGFLLMRRSADGLMDCALPPKQHRAAVDVLERYRQQGIDYHALRTRQSGARSFVDVHVLVPGAWTVQCGHDLLERLEADIRAVLPNVTVLTHLEPIEDPVAQADIYLDR